MARGRRKKRRGERGRGSIISVSPGKWRVRVNVLQSDGSKKTVTKTVYSLEEGEVVRQKILDEHPAPSPASGQSVKAAILRWQRDVAKDCEHNTAVSQKYALKHISAIEEVDINRLRPVDVSDWLAELESSGVGGESRKKAFGLLKRALSYAVVLGQITVNPCQDVPVPKSRKRKTEAFSEQEANQILQEVSGSRDEAVFYLGLVHGLRQGEIFGLQWKHVDLKRKTVTIERQLIESEGVIFFKETPKTENSYRTLNLTARSADALLQRKAEAIREKCGDPESVIFLNENGQPVRRSNFANRRWKPLLAKLKLPTSGFHKTRHTAASIMLDRGLPLSTVAAVLGDTVDTVARTYTHFIRDDHSHVADLMGSLGNPAKKRLSRKKSAK